MHSILAILIVVAIAYGVGRAHGRSSVTRGMSDAVTAFADALKGKKK